MLSVVVSVARDNARCDVTQTSGPRRANAEGQAQRTRTCKVHPTLPYLKPQGAWAYPLSVVSG